MMAVPQYPYPVLGGLERQSHELAKALMAEGHEVQALSGRIAGGAARSEVVEGVRVHRIPWPQSGLARFLVGPPAILWVLCRRRNSYDVVHLHQFSWFGAFVILSSKLLGKAVLTKLPSVGDHSLPGIARAPLGRLKIGIFKLNDAVIAMSTESVRELMGIAFPPQRILRTPNGITLGAPPVTRDAGGPCRVVFVGRLSREKLLTDLLHAWKLVQEQSRAPAVLELWGDGPDRSALEDLAASLGIAAAVRFRGYLADVRTRLGAMDVFVLTSVREGNSNAILEAMCAGLPVVSTRVGGTPMLVGDAGAHLLVAPGDTAGLAERLRMLVEDPPGRREQGRRMYDRILAHFDMRRVAHTYSRAYACLAARRRQDIHTVSDEVIALP
jgi:glycosyltransferase involved in cell wall biosynthesis